MEIYDKVPDFLRAPSVEAPNERIRGRGFSFMEKATRSLVQLLRNAYVQWDLSSGDGLLQRTDPRVKILGLIILVVLVSIKHSVASQLFVLVCLLLLTAFSRVGFSSVYSKALAMAFLFGVLIPAPSCLNLFSQGEMVLTLFKGETPSSFLWIRIPDTVGITKEGLSNVFLLWFRVFNSLTGAFLLVNTTSLNHILKGLKHLKVPDGLLLVILLTYRYSFIFLDLLEQMHRAKMARLVKGGRSSEMRKWAGERLGFIFGKAELRCDQTNRAMQGRGFSGGVRVEPLERMGKSERWKLVILCAWAVATAFM